ncbi:MAG: restriction endonuclease subunit S [Bacteroidales bacterium]|nr:restriction endonuclease subunit S [Bacteroidales bacterium]
MKEGWKYMKLGDVADVIHGKCQKEVISEHGQYPIYGSGGNIMGYANEYICEAGTTILGRKGSINNPQFISSRFWNVDTAFGISAKSGYDNKFIFYFIKNIDWSKKNTGTTLPSLTQQVVKSTPIPVPSLPEQQRIVSYLDAEFAKIEALKANAEKQLQAAKDLFQSALKELLTPKDGWEEDKLNLIFNFIDYRGQTPTKIESGVPLITAKNVKYGYIDYTIKDYISQEEYELRKGRGVSRKGDLLFTTEAPLGNVAIADLDEYSAGQRIITLQQYDESKYKIDNRFYYYYMLSPVFQNRIKGLATGATAQGIKAKILKSIIVPVPPFDFQQQIADKLDALSAKVKALQSNYNETITLCNDLKQSLLKDIFE